jgi:hypothetical protein
MRRSSALYLDYVDTVQHHTITLFVGLRGMPCLKELMRELSLKNIVLDANSRW